MVFQSISPVAYSEIFFHYVYKCFKERKGNRIRRNEFKGYRVIGIIDCYCIAFKGYKLIYRFFDGSDNFFGKLVIYDTFYCLFVNSLFEISFKFGSGVIYNDSITRYRIKKEGKERKSCDFFDGDVFNLGYPPQLLPQEEPSPPLGQPDSSSEEFVHPEEQLSSVQS